MKEAKRPHRKPDVVVQAYGVVKFWWKERIVSDNDNYYHINPDDWSYYKCDTWVKIGERFFARHGKSIKDSYAAWALERELL